MLPTSAVVTDSGTMEDVAAECAPAVRVISLSVCNPLYFQPIFVALVNLAFDIAGYESGDGGKGEEGGEGGEGGQQQQRRYRPRRRFEPNNYYNNYRARKPQQGGEEVHIIVNCFFSSQRFFSSLIVCLILQGKEGEEGGEGAEGGRPARGRGAPRRFFRRNFRGGRGGGPTRRPRSQDGQVRNACI